MRTLLAMVVCLTLALHAQASAQSTAVKDATAKMQTGDYKEALKVIAKAMEDTPANAQEERYELLMLRGECQLQTRQLVGARATFDLAATLTSDAKQVAQARGTAVLIRASTDGKYRPQGVNTTVYDIINPETRRDAFAALRVDRQAAIKGKYDKSMDATSLRPMMDILPQMLDIGYLEYMGNGKADETREEIKAMGERARGLMNDEIKRMRYRFGALVSVSHNQWDGMSRGINSNERKELKENVTYLRQIEKTARDVRRKALELGFDGRPWEPIIADSGDLADRIEAVADTGP